MGKFNNNKVKVWDVPTRFFHWSLVISIFICWLSMDQRWLDVHKISGVFVLFLLIYRLIWGVVGAQTARFINFLSWPKEALQYLKRSLTNNSEYHAGHNPAGGWMVIAFIFIILLEVLAGMFSNDDIGFYGPFADGITKEYSDMATQLHIFLFDVLLILIWLHLVAVFFYVLVKSQNLVSAMITGDKPTHQVGGNKKFSFTSPLVTLVVYVIAAVIPIYILF